LFPLLAGPHRVLGLALIPQVDHPRVTLLLQLVQVHLRGLVPDRDRRSDRSLDVHGPPLDARVKLTTRSPGAISAPFRDLEVNPTSPDRQVPCAIRPRAG